MVEILTELDRLGETIGSMQLKLAITFAAVALVLFVLLTYRRLQSWVSDRSQPLYGDIVATTAIIGTCAVSLAVVLGVWEQTEAIEDVFSSYDLSGGLVVNAGVSLILVIATLIFTRFVKRVIDEVLGSASAVTDHQREITQRISQVIIWAVSLVVVLGVWTDDLGGLLVGAGFLGIVVGMAARQTLGTVLAGFVLMFDRPFEIGDWIEVDGEEGIVTDISIVNTRIRSFDGEYIMIPNDVVSSEMVTNRSKRGRLRIEVDVGVDYDSDVRRAAELAESTVDDLEHALSAPGPQVVSKEFGDSAVVLGVRFWIDKPTARRRSQARTAAINAIKDAFEAEDIKIPYPQRELSGRAETGGFRIAGDGANSEAATDDDTDGGREHRMTQPEDD